MLISVDRDRRILGADRSARHVLSRSGHDRLEQGVGLWAVFEQNDALFRHMDRGDILTEVRPRGSTKSWPAIVTPPEPALARWSPSASEELRLRSRLDTLAISRQVSKPSRARGGLPPATLRNHIRGSVLNHIWIRTSSLNRSPRRLSCHYIILPAPLSGPKGQHPILSY